jgi:hypothetical protein
VIEAIGARAAVIEFGAAVGIEIEIGKLKLARIE